MPEIIIQTPTPHSPGQHQIMATHLSPYLEEVWVACGTKYGKSVSAGSSLVVAAPLRPDTLWRWVAPIYSQAKIGMKYCRKFLPPSPFTELNQSALTINIPSIDTQLQFFHGQNPTSLEGEAVHGYVLDEAAKLKQDVYASARTTVTQTRGRILGVSTPLGKNWFWQRCMAAQEEMIRAAHEKRPTRMLFIHAPTAANPHVPRESIESARRNLPDRLFRQYYLAEFLDDGSVFMFLAEAFDHVMAFSVADYWMADSVDSDEIYVGADWAKMNDYTVFVAMDRQGRMIGYKRFNRLPYPEQVKALYAFCAALNSRNVRGPVHTVVRHDQTGVGEAIADILAVTNTHDISVYGVVWNNRLKESCINDLILSFEERVIRLAAIQVLKSELEAFEVQFTALGASVFGAPSGMHDDTVMALALANSLFRENRNGSSSVVMVDYINQVLNKIHYSGGDID